MPTLIRSNRLEAFSDGVMSIIITIMVLEFKVPRASNLADLKQLIPIFVSYVLSFITVAIYWNNHHHLFRAAEEINGKVMWANMNLLFWLSLLPFTTAWMGQNQFTKWPVFVYGIVVLCCGLAYNILTRCLLTIHSKESVLVSAMTKNNKEVYTIGLYASGVAFSFVNPLISLGLYFAVAILWFIPDTRIEEQIKEMQHHVDEEENEQGEILKD